MKLAPVLSKYLTANKALNLPGLGTFYAENAYDPNVDYSKKGATLLNVTFEQKNITKLDDDLIEFVSKETGKMRVLSESDLQSQINNVLDFLNTGKPYFLPGIGTLARKPDGTYEFHKEKYHVEKKREIPINESNSVPKSYIDETRKPRNMKAGITILTLCILAIITVAWFYIRNSEKNKQASEDITNTSEHTQPTNISADTNTKVVQKPTPAVQPVSGSHYKYILETALQPRALKRYNQLKKINWPVEIETSDSTNYKLFIRLPVTNADTTRIKDSLSSLSGKRVWIER